MSRVAIAIAAHGLPCLIGILSVPIEGTHSLSLTVVRAYSAAGGGWAVQQGRGHVLATWLAMAGPCCGGTADSLPCPSPSPLPLSMPRAVFTLDRYQSGIDHSLIALESGMVN